MSEQTEFPVPEDMAKRALVDAAKYVDMYKRSIADNEGFWAEQGKRLDWIKPYTKIKDVDYTGEVHIRWYYDGTLNVSANCIDRHLAKRANQISNEIKEELNGKLSEFNTTADTLDEIFENREQIEISKYYERLPKPTLIAAQEFLENKIYHRNPSKEVQ